MHCRLSVFFLILFIYIYTCKCPTSQRVIMPIHPWSIRRLTAQGECGHHFWQNGLQNELVPSWQQMRKCTFRAFVWSAGSLLFQVVVALQHTEWTHRKSPDRKLGSGSYCLCLSLLSILSAWQVQTKNNNNDWLSDFALGKNLWLIFLDLPWLKIFSKLPEVTNPWIHRGSTPTPTLDFLYLIT